jgi:hypothetical protein
MKGSLFILLLALTVPAFAGPVTMAKACVDTFLAFADGEPREYIDDRVEVICYPFAGHVKVRVDDLVYGNECPNDRCAVHTIEAIDRLGASHLASGPEMRMRIRVTPKELADIRDFIATDQFGEGLNCAHSVCRLLNQHTGAWVPYPFQLGPLMTAVTLATERMVPGSRVVGMRLIPRVPKPLPTVMVFVEMYAVVTAVSVSTSMAFAVEVLIQAALSDDDKNKKAKEDAEKERGNKKE